MASSYTWQRPDVVRERLGFTMPTLSVLRQEGLHELYATLGCDEVERPSEVHPSGGNAVRVAYVPDEQSLNLTEDEGYHHGMTTLTMVYGSGAPWPDEAPRTRRAPASGDSTVVDLRGHHVGVQHRPGGLTRLAWVLRRPEAGYNIEVYTGRPPLEAVRMLAASDLFT
ncbi:hypothetical protein CLV92_1024 [Kineococcus xinjiangensis]|uniref:Uncharacterized protein n=1 Tax=Kineococcus xinjiangensis TaxID=512762 RepID=A0A2S6IUX0_9ACTN|nr:hypothetical protein [Kineococcus xinjiangensis]PPK97854.1 hypothetical protein CLV92_1024 [Kineococcus xinjiangensis]